jgi:hypothetical protein
MTEKIKINDTTVAIVGTQEVKRVFTSTDLTVRKERLETELKEVNELLAILKA